MLPRARGGRAARRCVRRAVVRRARGLPDLRAVDVRRGRHAPWSCGVPCRRLPRRGLACGRLRAVALRAVAPARGRPARRSPCGRCLTGPAATRYGLLGVLGELARGLQPRSASPAQVRRQLLDLLLDVVERRAVTVAARRAACRSRAACRCATCRRLAGHPTTCGGLRSCGSCRVRLPSLSCGVPLGLRRVAVLRAAGDITLLSLWGTVRMFISYAGWQRKANGENTPSHICVRRRRAVTRARPVQAR